MCWDNPRGSAAAGPSVGASGPDASQLAGAMPSFGLAQGFTPSSGWSAAAHRASPVLLQDPLDPATQLRAAVRSEAAAHGPAPRQDSAQPPLAYIARPGDSEAPCEAQEDDQPWTKRQAVRAEVEEAVEAGVEMEEEVYEEPEDATEELPDECLSQIFASLHNVEDRMACALVCRRWLHVASLSRKKRRAPARARVPPAAPAAAARRRPGPTASERRRQTQQTLPPMSTWCRGCPGRWKGGAPATPG